MRIGLLIVFLLIFLAGLALGLGYPRAVYKASGDQIARWRVQHHETGFERVEATLAPTDAPVHVLVDLTALRGFSPSPGRAVLTLTAATDERTVLAETLTFVDAITLMESPQAAERTYRVEAGVIDPVENGRYTFVLGPGDAEDVTVRAVDLTLRAGVMSLQSRLTLAGYGLAAVGLFGMVITIRYRRRPRNPNEKPPPRWGRGAA